MAHGLPARAMEISSHDIMAPCGAPQKENHAESDDDGFLHRQRRQGLTQPSLSAQGNMRVPDRGTSVGTGGGQHRQFAHLRGQRGLVAHVLEQRHRAAGHLRAIFQHGVRSKNQTGSGLCRKHRIVWGRMVAIGQITLANPDDGPFVAVVIEIKDLHRHSACGCLPNNA